MSGYIGIVYGAIAFFSEAIPYSPKGQPLPIQPRKKGKAKVYQFQQFFEYQEVGFF